MFYLAGRYLKLHRLRVLLNNLDRNNYCMLTISVALVDPVTAFFYLSADSKDRSLVHILTPAINSLASVVKSGIRVLDYVVLNIFHSLSLLLIARKRTLVTSTYNLRVITFKVMKLQLILYTSGFAAEETSQLLGAPVRN
jgi:hypothetical protein